MAIYGMGSAMKETIQSFKSLADETRIRLLMLLHSGVERCVCDLMHGLDLPQSTVSRHLANLRRNGWLQGRRSGMWMYYSLRGDLDIFLRAQLTLLIDHLKITSIGKRDQERLEAYLLTKDGNSCT